MLCHEQTLVLVEPYLKKPSFDLQTMERKSENKACVSLCKWVKGVCSVSAGMQSSFWVCISVFKTFFPVQLCRYFELSHALRQIKLNTMFLFCRYHRIMISKVKPLHKKVEETTQAIDNAEHKMNVLENKRKVSHLYFYK